MKKNQWMKKCCAFVAVMASMFVVCGCGNKADTLKPYEWIMDDKVVSYYDSAKEIDEKICQKYEGYIEGAMSDSVIWVAVNEDDEIRCFCTEDASVVTYKGISVGDKVRVVEDTFSYEMPIGESYNVFFDGTTEVEAKEYDNRDDLILLYYVAEDGIIQEIVVSDGVFGRTME